MIPNDDLALTQPFRKLWAALRFYPTAVRLGNRGRHSFIGVPRSVLRPRKILLGSNVFVAGGVVMGDTPISVLDNTIIQSNVSITGNGRVEIGPDCVIGPNCVIGAHPSTGSTGAVLIAAGVTVGANSTIANGVRIGPNAIIAPNSYVASDVAAGQKISTRSRLRYHRDFAVRGDAIYIALIVLAIALGIATGLAWPTWIALATASLWGSARTLPWLVAVICLTCYLITSPLGYFSGGWGDYANELSGNAAVLSFMTAVAVEIVAQLRFRVNLLMRRPQKAP